VRLCLDRLEDSLNPFPQTGHLRGFRPEWTRWCIAGGAHTEVSNTPCIDLVDVRTQDVLSALGYRKALLQILHTNGFSLLWINMCWVRACFAEKPLLQVGQM
jgi:hypothetical protein